ncbi:hypothetical protein B0H67DRAFT_640846 [Lasiosphaeris hirsuta]|uniref:Uncharacterized protein n=1 Tax=Lasiosphaeris hirsuta TaxID=260670 RepID=A0AA40AYE7_9PEZI|nr:hypothetical protein B0H67DRAFT_640846 [Lasiosphaeris hirsuta]
MATLHSRLGSDLEVQDYHFLVDSVDHHHHITHDSFLVSNFPQLDQLKEAFPYATIRVHFNPTTGEMTVTTLSECVKVELQFLLGTKLRQCIAALPRTAATPRAYMCLHEDLGSEVPHCLVALYQSDHDVDPPSLTISATTIGNQKKAAKSILANVLARHPGLQTMVRLDFGGLTMDKAIDKEHHEQRVRRIADLSSVLTWRRDEYGNITSTYESLSKEDGELRLHLLQVGIEVVIKYSEILDVISMAGAYMPLGGVDKSRTPQSSMGSLFSPLLGHHRFRASSNVSIKTHVARRLGLGSATTTAATATTATTATTSMLGGHQGTGVFRPLPYTANRARIAVASWGRLLARLPRKL